MTTPTTTPAEGSDTGHTPTPWYVQAGSSIESDGAFYIRSVSKPNTCIAKLDGHSSEIDEANAALIVRAVNSHAALVNAIEWLVMRMESEKRRFPLKEQKKRELHLRSARAALALAKEVAK
jgi:hypothetical protein